MMAARRHRNRGALDGRGPFLTSLVRDDQREAGLRRADASRRRDSVLAAGRPKSAHEGSADATLRAAPPLVGGWVKSIIGCQQGRCLCREHGAYTFLEVQGMAAVAGLLTKWTASLGPVQAGTLRHWAWLEAVWPNDRRRFFSGATHATVALYRESL